MANQKKSSMSKTEALVADAVQAALNLYPLPAEIAPGPGPSPCDDGYREWATNWLDGTDRSWQSARRAAAAANTEAADYATHAAWALAGGGKGWTPEFREDFASRNAQDALTVAAIVAAIA